MSRPENKLSRVKLCPAKDIPVGGRKVFRIGKKIEVGVFNVKGTYHALMNRCPHASAPLCLGHVTGTTCGDRAGEFNWEREGEIIRCPWHGWEFAIATGESVFNPHRVKGKHYEVSIDTPSEEEDESVEHFDVTEQEAWLYLHLKTRTTTTT